MRFALVLVAAVSIIIINSDIGSSPAWDFTSASLRWGEEFTPARESIQFLYGADSDTDFFIRIDPETGEGTDIGPLGVDIGAQGINFDQDDEIFGLFWNNDSLDYRLYKVDRLTGEAREVGPLNLGLSAQGTDIAIDSAGTIYGVIGNLIVEIDRFTGAADTAYLLPVSYNLNGLDYSPDWILYASGVVGSLQRLLTIDIGSQTNTIKGDLEWGCPGIAFDGNGILYGAINAFLPNELAIIDTSNAVLTLVGPIGYNQISGMDGTTGIDMEILYALPYARPGYLTWWKIVLINTKQTEVDVDRIRLNVTGDINVTLTIWQGNVTIPPDSEATFWIDLPVPGNAPFGLYTLESVAEYQGQVVASSHFDIEVVD